MWDLIDRTDQSQSIQLISVGIRQLKICVYEKKLSTFKCGRGQEITRNDCSLIQCVPYIRTV